MAPHHHFQFGFFVGTALTSWLWLEYIKIAAADLEESIKHDVEEAYLRGHRDMHRVPPKTPAELPTAKNLRRAYRHAARRAARPGART